MRERWRVKQDLWVWEGEEAVRKGACSALVKSMMEWHTFIWKLHFWYHVFPVVLTQLKPQLRTKETETKTERQKEEEKEEGKEEEKEWVLKNSTQKMIQHQDTKTPLTTHTHNAHMHNVQTHLHTQTTHTHPRKHTHCIYTDKRGTCLDANIHAKHIYYTAHTRSSVVSLRNVRHTRAIRVKSVGVRKFCNRYTQISSL